MDVLQALWKTECAEGHGYEIVVKTRDCKGADTDSDVYINILGKNGESTEDLLLDNRLRDDLERGREDIFSFPNIPQIKDVEKIVLWRNAASDDDEWFCECIIVKEIHKDQEKEVSYPFPCHQWVSSKRRYELFVYNFCLPQLDQHTSRQAQRKLDVEEGKKLYAYEEQRTGFPRRIAKMPAEEEFTSDYQWDITSRKYKLFAVKKLEEWFMTNNWETFEDMKEVYIMKFTLPKGWHNWRSDERFGDQRLNGNNTSELRRCDQLPSHVPVTDEMVGQFLEGKTLVEAMQEKRLFVADLTDLEGVSHQENCPVPAPTALLYANKDGNLMPIAIQLNPVPGPDNPIFLPSDPEYTWMMAKMFYNLADASIHQSCNHLGYTHMVVESILCAVHQSLPQCHPVFQLLAPHFLFLVAIDTVGLNKLLDAGGWFDTAMSIGSAGFYEILRNRWKNWRFDVDGWYPTSIKNRGVDDTDILRHYYERDDSLMLHDTIVEYVRDVLTQVYDTHDKLIEDHEIQEFAKILVDDDTGAGFKGVFGNGSFHDLEDLIKVVSATIFMSSVGHAATNFGQYDEYAFPPNYPAMLHGEIPKDKTPLTLQDIISALPNRETTLSTMVVTHLLSGKSTESLGYFDIPYMYEPKAVAAVARFQDNLKIVGLKIDERNSKLEVWRKFPYLHPREVPNAISI